MSTTVHVTGSDTLAVTFPAGTVQGTVQIADGCNVELVNSNGTRTPLIKAVPDSPSYDALYQVTKTNHERNVINRLYNRYTEEES